MCACGCLKADLYHPPHRRQTWKLHLQPVCPSACGQSILIAFPNLRGQPSLRARTLRAKAGPTCGPYLRAEPSGPNPMGSVTDLWVRLPTYSRWVTGCSTFAAQLTVGLPTYCGYRLTEGNRGSAAYRLTVGAPRAGAGAAGGKFRGRSFFIFI